MRVPNTIQSEQQLKDTLDFLYAKSKEGKSFTGLLEVIANEQTIITAIHNIKSNKGSKTKGVDGKTIDFYLQLPRNQFIGMIKSALMHYQPKPIRRTYIPKRNGKMRPLGIPSILDRIIQECVRLVIEPILEARFYPHSYGFRPYRATKHAVARVVYVINRKRYYGIEGDIKGFFDHINHRLLMQKLHKLGIIDKRVLAIIKKMLKANILENGTLHKSMEGAIQGGILSPLLANAYLNDFDWVMARKYHKHRMVDTATSSSNGMQMLRRRGIEPVFLTRYADDWILQTTSEREARKQLAWLKKYFKHRLKLELSEEKTLITNCRVRAFQFLGFCIKAAARRKTPNKPKICIVAKAYPNPKRLIEQQRHLIERIHKLKLQTDEWRVAEIERINAKIVGIAEYWKIGVSSLALHRLNYTLENSLYLVFKKIYGDDVMSHKVPFHQLANRPGRHLTDARGRPFKRTAKTWAIQMNDLWIGITHAAITPIEYARQLNPEFIPFTKEGRRLYVESREGHKLPLARPPLYDDMSLFIGMVGIRGVYNFEFTMNREYAFNQTLRKGKYLCNVCKAELAKGNRECHHRNPNLPLNLINKVSNLVWLCIACHHLVEKGIPERLSLGAKQRRKINKLRSIKFGSEECESSGGKL